MAKRKRRAKNKIEGSPEGSLIKADVDPLSEPPAVVFRSNTVAVVRSSLFTAEFEAVIELIARERVYRAMLAGLGRRLLMGPSQPQEPPA
jgi:hypothetical protein